MAQSDAHPGRTLRSRDGRQPESLYGLPFEHPFSPRNRNTRICRAGVLCDRRKRGEYVGRHYLQFAGSRDFFLKAGADAPETLLAYADFDGTTALRRKADSSPRKAAKDDNRPHGDGRTDGVPAALDGGDLGPERQLYRRKLIGNDNHDNSKYCFAKPGELYLVYLPQGGTTEIDLRGTSGTFFVHWFDPRHGGPLVTGSARETRGGERVLLGPPPQDAGEDWLIVLRKAGT